MRRRLRSSSILLSALAALLVAPGAAHAGDCVQSNVAPTSADTIAGARVATLCLLNDQRAAAGLTPLATDPTLQAVADSYSLAMVTTHIFAHVLPNGIVLEQRLSGYLTSASQWFIGENLGWGEGSLSTPAQIVDAWMHSDAHRANILNASFRDIGIGISLGSPIGSIGPSATYTTDFGARTAPAAVTENRTVSAAAPRAPRPAARRPLSRADCTHAALRRLSAARRRVRTSSCAKLRHRQLRSRSHR